MLYVLQGRTGVFFIGVVMREELTLKLIQFMFNFKKYARRIYIYIYIYIYM